MRYGLHINPKWLAISSMVLVMTPLGISTVLAERAHAATCRILRASVRNVSGQNGGTIQATICKTPYGSYMDETSYNYVQDLQADGKTAYAWLDTSLNERVGPSGEDDTSTPGGMKLASWSSQVARPAKVRIYVCLGKASPWSRGRCASAAY